MFLIFIPQNALEPSSMQVEIHHIGRSECTLWQDRKEQFVDHLAPRGPDRRSGGSRRMGCDDHPDARSCRGQKQVWAVKECSTGSRFGIGGLLIGWLGQASLHLRQIEQIVVPAAHHIGQASQIYHDSPIAILAIQPYHGLTQGKRLSFHIRADRLHRLAQLSSVIAVACLPKGAELCGIKTDMSSDNFRVETWSTAPSRAELCGIKTDMSRVIELAHPFPWAFSFLLSFQFSHTLFEGVKLLLQQSNRHIARVLFPFRCQLRLQIHHLRPHLI